MNHRLYYVSGSKGGVGKSFVCNSLVFWLLENGRRVRVIDTDDSNPDVARIYERSIGADYLPLTDNNRSWESFLNRLDELSGEAGDSQLNVVVNGAARDNKAIERNGDLLNAIFQQNRLKYDFSTLWVMSDSIDSVDLLKKYLSVVHIGNIFALRNLQFGDENPKNFVVFDEAMPSFLDRIDKILDFPKLEESLASMIHRNKMMLSDVEKTGLKMGSLMLFERWLSNVRRVFSELDSFIIGLEKNNNADATTTIMGAEEANTESKAERGKK